MIPDDQQDWVLDEQNSQSTCPYLQKCVFQCAVSREFSTEDVDDFDFSSSSLPNVFFGYFVTIEDIELFAGYHHYSNFRIPLSAGRLAFYSLAIVVGSVLLTI